MKQASKIYKLPIFWKFAIVSTMAVTLFGLINIYMLWSSVYTSFEEELDKRCNILAQIVAEKALDPMAYGDDMSLYTVLDQVKKSDPSISYIFILDKSNKIISQTYDINIPDELVNANPLSVVNGVSIKVLETRNFEYNIVRDIAYPILKGDVGVVRLGITEDFIREKILEDIMDFIIMIFSFLVLGLLGALFFSYLITRPITEISNMAQIVDLNNIDSDDFKIDSRKRMRLFNIQLEDELDVLVAKFSEMIQRLRSNYRELKETESALVQAERLASLGTLSAGVAHEINNPISGIQNCVNRIIKDPDNREQNIKYISLIKEATDKIQNVVQHLLKFGRKQKLSFENININTAIENAISLTNHEIQKNQISIKFNDKEGCYVNGSSSHLEQVFVNMLLNSKDAILEKKGLIPALKGKIEIFIESKTNKLTVHFKDNGIGMPKDIQGKIFDPFFTSKNVGKGTGLGLSVSFNLIKKHKGDIRFNSDENIGTEFIIELPQNNIV
jgi:two-component system NtrC family sensor kinase